MSLRDFNEPSQPLHAEPWGNGAGLGSFHTIHPEEREPSNTPKILGALAVALMMGAAGIGLYAYSGSNTQPKPVVADNSLPQPPASAPIAPPPPAAQQTADNANMPADTTTPAMNATAKDSTPMPAKPAKHHVASNSANTQTASTASDASSVRMNADSNQTSQAPAQQAAVTPLPAAPQPSPSDVASNNSQAVQPEPSAPLPDTTQQTVQQPAPQQQPEQAGAAPAQAQ